MPFDALSFADQQTMDDLEIIERIRYRIRSPQLWCKDDWITGNRVCLLGAVGRVTTLSPRELRIFENLVVSPKIVEIITRYLPKGFTEVMKFNDSPRTKHADVIAVLD